MSELPTGWAPAALADLGAWCGGGTPSKARSEFWTDGKIPWVSPKDMKVDLIGDAEDYITEDAVAGSATNVVPTGSVLVVTRSGILRRTLPVAVTGSAVALNQDLKALTPAAGIEPRYVAWGLRMAEQRILHECSKDGTTVDSIDFPEFLRHVLPLAPSREQERIVAAIEEHFSQIDVGVAAIGRTRQNLRRVRAAVLQAAVTGRLLPQDFSEGSGDSLLADIRVGGQPARRSRQSGRPNEAFATQLPALPGNWASARWATIGRSQNGRLFPSRDYSTQGIRLLRPGNLDISGHVVWNPKNTKYLPTQYASDFPTYLVGPNEIVMNLTAQSLRDEFLGRVCMTGDDVSPDLSSGLMAGAG